MAKTILVIGATGTVGRLLVDALAKTGATVKAASRTGAAVGPAEGVAFELTDPSTYEAAFSGVDRIFVMAPKGAIDVKGLLSPVIAAATSRRIKVVLMTALGVDADDAIPYRQLELALERSGAPFVILRPNWFADNFHNFWRKDLDQGRIALPTGDGRTSLIDARDVAESAAAALTSDRFDGRAFNLTGPETLSYGEAADILSQVIGKPIANAPVDDETFVQTQVARGMPEAYARYLAAIFAPVAQGWTAAVSDGVETITGQRPRSLQTYVTDNADRLRG